jgi:beta-lactam-binding protein with PASTA domain
MLFRLVKGFFLGLVLLLVFLSCALLSMRFAIQGREVHVPRLQGLTPAEAERVANSDGLVLSVESRFYSSGVPEGRIVSQSPPPDATVRRGWKIRVAESLGPQRAAIPNLAGQSLHAAGLNISRRGLQIGSMATLHLPGAQPETVVAQSPSPSAKDVTSPKIGLVFSAADNAQRYIMPSFVGRPLTEATAALQHAGFSLDKVQHVDATGSSAAPGTILRQYPPAGQRITAGTGVNFEIQR